MWVTHIQTNASGLPRSGQTRQFRARPAHWLNMSSRSRLRPLVSTSVIRLRLLDGSGLASARPAAPWVSCWPPATWSVPVRERRTTPAGTGWQSRTHAKMACEHTPLTKRVHTPKWRVLDGLSPAKTLYIRARALTNRTEPNSTSRSAVVLRSGAGWFGQSHGSPTGADSRTRPEWLRNVTRAR